MCQKIHLQFHLVVDVSNPAGGWVGGYNMDMAGGQEEMGDKSFDWNLNVAIMRLLLSFYYPYEYHVV